MAITRQQKENIVKEIKQDIESSKSIVFTDFQGMDVNTITELRSKISEAGGAYKVVKKTLLKKALEDSGIGDINIMDLEGQIAVAFSNEDVVSVAKVLYDTNKKLEVPQVLKGYMEGRVLEAAEVNKLATIPSREELLAKLVGSINAPVSGLVNVLAGNVRGLVYTLNAIKEQKS